MIISCNISLRKFLFQTFGFVLQKVVDSSLRATVSIGVQWGKVSYDDYREDFLTVENKSCSKSVFNQK